MICLSGKLISLFMPVFRLEPSPNGYQHRFEKDVFCLDGRAFALIEKKKLDGVPGIRIRVVVIRVVERKRAGGTPKGKQPVLSVS